MNPSQQHTILLVDDHPMMRHGIRQMLELEDDFLIVGEASNGEEALGLIEPLQPDLVLLDNNMPVMNGYQLTQAIREEEHTKGLAPCLILGFTANAQQEERTRCIKAGMDDCLFKPLTLTALSQWVASIAPTDHAPAFSLEGLHRLTGGNPAMDLRLLTELFTSNRLDRQALQALSRSSEPRLFLDIAHKIKGAARIVQASRLIDSCEALEQACHEGFLPDEVAESAAAVERAMLELEQALQQQIAQNDKSRMMEP